MLRKDDKLEPGGGDNKLNASWGDDKPHVCARLAGAMTRSNVAGAGSSYNRGTVTLDFLGNLQRTQMCGELRASDSGSPVTLMGWVNRRRDHGNLIFLDVRDRTGITQVVFDKESSP